MYTDSDSSGGCGSGGKGRRDEINSGSRDYINDDSISEAGGECNSGSGRYGKTDSGIKLG